MVERHTFPDIAQCPAILPIHLDGSHELDRSETSGADQQIEIRLHIYDFAIVILHFHLTAINTVDWPGLQIDVGETKRREVVICDNDTLAAGIVIRRQQIGRAHV